jgi:lysophospholipase L1-like esterase
VVGSRVRAAVGGVVALVLLGACVPPPGGGGPEPRTYAALGDSFSSGDGAGSYDPEPASCKRSAFAWPRVIDAQVDLRACSGADVAEVGTQIPGEANSDITLVTLTAGGNDAGFGDIFEACLLGACPSPTDPAFVADLAAMQTALGTLYGQLEAAYPSARIIHVGYPRLTPPPGDPVGACFWLPPADQAAAAAIVDAINDVIETAVDASSTDVQYLDVTDAFEDHELCTAQPWVSLVARAHPNLAGQRALASDVSASL